MAVVSTTSTSLPYHEPSISTILVLTSFLLSLNVVNYLLDITVFCGLIGQIFIGTLLGAPITSAISLPQQESITSLGYLGLLLLVYHGGLNTSLNPLLTNLPLSITVALTGISLPIALSFLLTPLCGATPIQAFSAGAALSATSLGTTFTILSTAGFEGSRLGVVLTSAAMMDDVVGLVMISVVGKLGDGISAESVARPIGASVGVVVAVVLFGWIGRTLRRKFDRRIKWLDNDGGVWVTNTLVLVISVVVSGYSGTSVLFGAFIAGALVTWWDESFPGTSETEERTGKYIYGKYFETSVERILVPFFFASIGFSIPLKRMFTGRIVWRGMIYTVLMFFAKLATGVWLLLVDRPFGIARMITKAFGKKSTSSLNKDNKVTMKKMKLDTKLKGNQKNDDKTASLPTPPDSPTRHNNTEIYNTDNDEITSVQPTQPIAEEKREEDPQPNKSPKAPLSLYPSCILGLAMVARGEIAYLIASIASSTGIFTSKNTDGQENDDIFLVVIWAATLCTIIGPLGVGFLVRRVKKLESKKSEGTGRGNVLGDWGVVATRN